MTPPPSLDALDRPLAPEIEPEGQTLSLRNLLIPIALSVAVLGVVFWATYDPDALAQMARLNVGLLALAFAMVGTRILLNGLRLTYISHGHLTTTAGIRGGLMWDFMSAVTPSAMGGAPLAAYYLARENRLPVGDATGIMLFSMLTDQVWFAVSIPLVLVAATFFDVIPPALGSVGAGTLVFFLAGLMLWAIFFAYATLIRPSILEAAATMVVRIKWLRRWKGRVRRELVSMRHRSKLIRRQPPSFYAVSFLFSVGIWMARYATLVFVVLSVYPAFEAVTGLLRVAAMMLTGLLVPTPGGSGGIEGLYVLFLGDMMPQGLVGPTLLTWRLLSFHLFLAAGFVVMIQFLQRVRSRRHLPRRSPRPGPRDAHA
jgi:glycosyltransferase 2 family protein